MNRYDAQLAAGVNAQNNDKPAWICQEPEYHKRGQYFVVTAEYAEFAAKYNEGNCVAVVLPNGRTFQRVGWTSDITG